MKQSSTIVILFILNACTTTVVPEPTTVDTLAGTVDFSYTHSPGALPQIDWDDVQTRAVARCETLGFSNARNTDELDRVCVARGQPNASVRVGGSRSVYEPTQTIGIPVLGDSCEQIRYTVTYQCTD